MSSSPISLSRREVLQRTSMGFGALAMAGLMDKAKAASPLIPDSHFPGRARNIIFLFMEGGVSHVDSFDYKPMLEKYHGQDPRKAIGKLEKTQFENIGKVMKSPWSFKQRGESGMWVSDLFPHIAGMADDLCVVRSMTSNFPEHTSANYFFHSGTGLQGRPSMGAWASYGLGKESDNLPGYVVINGGRIPSGGLDCFSNGFLTATHRGSLLNANGTPVANVSPNERDARSQLLKRRLIGNLNARSSRGNAELESAIMNYELAARMQLAIPELMDFSQESASTKELYGIEDCYKGTQTYARECLIARRLIERGVRFVELTIPNIGEDRWDAHGGLQKNHGNNARSVDKPIAGLLKDLKARGMLDDTLVLWSGEFGRTPFAQGGNGRDHNEFGFSLWMAGAGVKPGTVYGGTDQWGYKAEENPLEVHDLHATILHLLGINHKELTYRFSGRDIRLTDVHGRVVEELLS